MPSRRRWGELDIEGKERGKRKSNPFGWVEMFGECQEARMTRVCATERKHLGNEVGGLGRGWILRTFKS